MRFDLTLRSGIRERLDALAQEMHAWEATPRFEVEELDRVQHSIQGFAHTTGVKHLTIAGVDGTGDYPAVTYGDSFVYATLAQTACYEANVVCGLKEKVPSLAPIVEFTWLPEDDIRRDVAFDAAFTLLAGMDVSEVIQQSDYRTLKARSARSANSASELHQGLVRPAASDAGNVGLQLRSTGEHGAALQMLCSDLKPDYVLMEGTFSLPFVSKPDNSLFYEHLKRLCCVTARQRGIGFFTLSKSHGLPAMEMIEELARECFGLSRGEMAEHWFLRLPIPGVDSWQLPMAEGRRLPPPGAVTYLVRFHRTTSILRLDMDREYWREQVRGATDEETHQNEQRLFATLDYACHDQRCFGYPYPIKAGQDRASLTQSGRKALRKQIIEAAVRAGMKRSLFRESPLAKNHE